MANFGPAAPAIEAGAAEQHRRDHSCYVLTLQNEPECLLAWAQIAAANLQAGDIFQIGLRRLTVFAVEDRQIRYGQKVGIKRIVAHSSRGWDAFIDMLAEQLGIECAAAAGRDTSAYGYLMRILMRDPLVAIGKDGMPALR